jgi:hypothetical protein
MNHSRLLIIAFILFLTACTATTSIVASWKDQESPPKTYQKVAVVVMSPTTSNRAIVEDAVAQEFRSRGITANATFNTFPFAGKIGEIDIDKTKVEQKIREKINDNHFDALMTIVLLDKQKEERYVEEVLYRFLPRCTAILIMVIIPMPIAPFTALVIIRPQQLFC